MRYLKNMKRMKIIRIPRRNVRYLIQATHILERNGKYYPFDSIKALERNMHETWIANIDIETVRILKTL